MKITTLIAIASLSVTASNAATILLTNISPNATAPNNGQLLIGASDNGGTLTATTAGFPIDSASAINSGTYAVSISGLTIDGTAGVTVTFDLTLTASAGHGMVVNGGSNKTWTVDRPAVGGNSDISRIDSGETITFGVSSLSVIAPVGFTGSATFDGFSDLAMINGTAGVFTAGTGVVSHDGSGTPFRADDLDLGLTVTVTAVPEPSSLGFMALGGLALIMRRRK